MGPRATTHSWAIAAAFVLCLSLGCCNAKLYTREQWGSQVAKNKTTITKPVKYVVIHHTSVPPVCLTMLDCMDYMRRVQKDHIEKSHWDDIGYSFCIGGDGNTYEGRGWGVVGAHAPNLNNDSVGICLFGDYTQGLPQPAMLNATKALIEQGVREGHIAQDYILLGHGDVNPTACPGRALQEEIKKWDHFGTQTKPTTTTTPFTPLYTYITRDQWKASPPNKTESMVGPIPVVVIHHTPNFTSCQGIAECSKTVREIQKAHLANNWDDIAFSFCVGGRGEAYVFEGRGWNSRSNFTYNQTDHTLDICIIGNYTTEEPSEQVLRVTQLMIEQHWKNGMLANNLKLTGHRNLVSNDDCPGHKLQEKIQKWKLFNADMSKPNPPPHPKPNPDPADPEGQKPSMAAPTAVWTMWHTAAILVFHGFLLGRY